MNCHTIHKDTIYNQFAVLTTISLFSTKWVFSKFMTLIDSQWQLSLQYSKSRSSMTSCSWTKMSSWCHLNNKITCFAFKLILYFILISFLLFSINLDNSAPSSSRPISATAVVLVLILLSLKL